MTGSIHAAFDFPSGKEFSVLIRQDTIFGAQPCGSDGGENNGSCSECPTVKRQSPCETQQSFLAAE